jgi:hypothetical protein
MLGSSHSGEVIAAVSRAERLRKDLDTTWPELLSLPPPPPGERPPPIDWRGFLDGWPATWMSLALLCLEHADAHGGLNGIEVIMISDLVQAVTPDAWTVMWLKGRAEILAKEAGQ